MRTLHGMHVRDFPNLFIVGFVQAANLVSNVTSGEEACEEVRRGLVPDIALVDYMLPGMNGIATVARMRQMPELAVTRYLLVTASVMSHQTAEFEAAGIAHYAKPIRRPELMAQWFFPAPGWRARVGGSW